LTPVEPLALDQAEDQSEETGGRQEDSPEVPSVAPGRAQVRDDDECRHQRCDANGDVDEEDPSPIDVGNDGATDGRPGEGSEARDACPDAKRRAAAFWREQACQYRQ